jgi:hypothetical protein
VVGDEDVPDFHLASDLVRRNVPVLLDERQVGKTCSAYMKRRCRGDGWNRPSSWSETGLAVD